MGRADMRPAIGAGTLSSQKTEVKRALLPIGGWFKEPAVQRDSKSVRYDPPAYSVDALLPVLLLSEELLSVDLLFLAFLAGLSEFFDLLA